MDTKVLIGGHRGLGCTDSDFAQKRNKANPVSVLLAENTLPSLLSALRQGASFIETDLIATADNEIVLTHSNDPSQHILLPEYRSANKTFIDEMTLNEIQDLRIGSKGEDKIPSLRELLRAIQSEFQGDSLILNLELKGVQGTSRISHTSPSLAELALKIVREEKFPLNRIRFSSFSLDMVEDLVRIAPKARVGILYDLLKDKGDDVGEKMFIDRTETYLLFTKDAVAETLRRIPTLEAVHPEIQTLTEETVGFIASKGLSVMTWGWLEETPLKNEKFAEVTKQAINICSAQGVPSLGLITDCIKDMEQYVALLPTNANRKAAPNTFRI